MNVMLGEWRGKKGRSPPNAVQLGSRHSVGVSWKPDVAYLENARPTV
jgi:hypothetical protein